MHIANKFTKTPLIEVGATSAIKIGIIVVVKPIPRPITYLPIISSLIECQNAIIIDPTIKSKSAIKTVIFLPYLSDKDPEINAPTAAPSNAIDTISSF